MKRLVKNERYHLDGVLSRTCARTIPFASTFDFSLLLFGLCCILRLHLAFALCVSAARSSAFCGPRRSFRQARCRQAGAGARYFCLVFEVSIVHNALVFH